MIGSRADVDETLRRMTESFRAGFGSLEGGLHSRRLRAESSSSVLATGSRTTPLIEDDIPFTSGGSPGGRRAHTLTHNLSLSSLSAGGRQSYDYLEQIVGRMDFTDDENIRCLPTSRRSDAATVRRLDLSKDTPSSSPPRRH